MDVQPGNVTAIFKAITVAAGKFLTKQPLDEVTAELLQAIGQAAEVSRVYLFQVLSDEQGKHSISQLSEWVAQNTTPQITNQTLQNLDLKKAGFARWIDVLSQGGVIHGQVSALPESERELLQSQEIQSILVVPVAVGQAWWGFIGFDECRSARAWRPVEIDALKTSASILGAALERQRAEEEKQQLLKRLTIIHDIDQAILTAQSAEEIAEAVLYHLWRLIPCQQASVILIDVAAGLFSTLAVAIGRETRIGQENYYAVSELGSDLDRLRDGQVVNSPMSEWRDRNSTLTGQLEQEGILSYTSIPLMVRDELIGALEIARDSYEPYTAEQIGIAREVANPLAIAIQNSRLLKAERQRRQEAEALISVTNAFASSLELDQTLERILAHLEQIVPFDSACIFLHTNGHLKAMAAKGLPRPETIVGHIFPADDALAEELFSSARPLILDNAQTHPSFKGWGETSYVRGWMGVPLIVRGGVIGYMTLDSRELSAFGKAEATLAQALANQTAVAIENARLMNETQRLLQQTRRQAQHLQHIMDVVPEGIILLDRQQQIILTNRASRDYLSDLAGDLQGSRLTHLGGKPIGIYLSTQGSMDVWHELRIEKPKRVYEVAVRDVVQKELENNWLLVIRNVTGEHEQQLYLAAQERLATVGQLAAGIAHDFNNIMAVIILYSQMLLRNTTLPDKDRQRLTTIYQQAQRAADLIRQILDFSRQAILERKPLDLLPFVKELVKLMERTLPESIHINLEYEPDEYLVNADVTRMQQMIMNLAVNARDAMPSGGKLTVKLSAQTYQPTDSLPLPDMTPGPWFQLQVRDTGSGMDSHQLSHIFEPFFSTKPTGEGTGLGLAQVYGIVKQHQGYIDVSSQIGVGSTFRIFLPALVREKLHDPDQDAGQLAMGNGETILVVEDDPTTRNALAEILALLNYQVLLAADGEEALKLFDLHEDQIAVILSDMVMPNVSGADLYHKLEQQGAAVKMVVLTGYPLEDSGKELIDRGVVAFIQKPLSLEEIAEAVQEALNPGS